MVLLGLINHICALYTILCMKQTFLKISLDKFIFIYSFAFLNLVLFM